MADQNESLSEKLIVVFFQTLIFGLLLAVFGYLLNVRLESYKHTLAEETEKTKVLLESLEPDLLHRRAAYIELQQAARETKQTLEIYYSNANIPTEHQKRRDQIYSLRDDLGISLGGGSSSWGVTKEMVVAVIENLICVREINEDIASDKIKVSVDRFIDAVILDLKKSTKISNNNRTFANSAQQRLIKGYDSLMATIELALGIDQLPVK